MAITLDGTLGITTPSETNTGTLSVTGVTTLTGGLNAALPVLSGGTGVTTKTGTGAVVLGTSPTITGATITVAATAAPAFSAYNNADQSFTAATNTKVRFNVEEFDTNSNFDSTTNYRFTPTVAGYYLITSQVYVAAQSGGMTNVNANIYKNGVIFKTGNVLYTPTYAVSHFALVISAIVYMNGTSDYTEIYAYSSGVSLIFTGGAGGTASYFQAAMIRSA